MATSNAETFVARREGDFWVNALIGAVATVVLSFVPVSPVLGGGIAGYLQGGTRTAGAKVGAVSGIIAALPVLGVVTLVFGGIGLGALVDGSALGFLLFAGVFLFAFLVTAVVAGGMGALGGYLGIVLRERSDEDDGDWSGGETDRPVDDATDVVDAPVESDTDIAR
jgi:hypothetical protein